MAEVSFRVTTDARGIVVEPNLDWEGPSPVTFLTPEAAAEARDALRACEADLRFAHPSSLLADAVLWIREELEDALEALHRPARSADLSACPPPPSCND